MDKPIHSEESASPAAGHDAHSHGRIQLGNQLDEVASSPIHSDAATPD